MSDLPVARDHRREGAARALVAAVQARAAELGCAAVDFDFMHAMAQLALPTIFKAATWDEVRAVALRIQ